jgi:uncharacterized membrane protein
MPAPASERLPASWYWSLAGLTLVGAAARVVALNSGMWIDEIYSLVRSFREPLGTILTDYWGDTHHPFYAVLAHASRSLFGEAPWTVRLPAALFGIATIPLLAVLARRVVPVREALLSALLLAVSYHHVWFSQNARGYSAIACFTVLAMLFAMRGLRSGRAADWGAYALVAALGTYTHLTMAFVVIGHAAAVAIEGLRRSRVEGAAIPWRAAALGFLASGALTMLFYAPMLSGVIAFFTETRSRLQGVSTPGWAALETLRVLALGMSGGVAALGAVIAVVGLGIAVVGGWSIGKRSPLFMLLLIAPVGATLAGAAVARGTLYPRFFFFAIGPALVIAVHGTFVAAKWVAARLLSSPERGTALGTAATAAVVGISVLTLPLNYRYPKQDFGGAMFYVSGARAADDLVASTGVPNDPYRTLYGRDWPNITTVEELSRLRSEGRVWVLSTFPRYIAARTPELARVLDAECGAIRVFRGTVSGGDIQVCVLSRQ